MKIRNTLPKFVSLMIIMVLLLGTVMPIMALANVTVGSDGNNNLIIDTSGLTFPSLVTDDDLTVATEAVNMSLTKYKNMITIIAGFGALFCGAILIFSITKLGASGGDPNARKQAVVAIFVSGIGLSLLGAIAVLSQMALSLFV